MKIDGPRCLSAPSTLYNISLCRKNVNKNVYNGRKMEEKWEKKDEELVKIS